MDDAEERDDGGIVIVVILVLQLSIKAGWQENRRNYAWSSCSTCDAWFMAAALLFMLQSSTWLFMLERARMSQGLVPLIHD